VERCANRSKSAPSAISRAARQPSYPGIPTDRCNDPCPCGYLGHFSGKCRCTPDSATLRHKLSDRSSIVSISNRVPVREDELVIGSRETLHVRSALNERRRQLARQGKNNTAGPREIERSARQKKGGALLRQLSQLISRRALTTVLKLART